MNILHVIAPVSFGGGEAVLVNLLGDKRHSLYEHVACLWASRHFSRRLEDIGVPCWSISYRELGHGVSRGRVAIYSMLNWRAIGRLRELVERLGIDIVHAHGFPASVLYPLLRSGTGVKGIYTHHNVRKKPRFLERIIFERTYDCFDIKTGVSNRVCRSMDVAFPGIKSGFETVYNCVGVNFFQCNRSSEFAYLKKSNTRIFVQPARFTKFKNHELVVRTLRQLSRAERDHIRVVFAGDGEERQKIMKLVRDYGLDETVYFLGAVAHEKLPSLLSVCDFGLFPSGEEEGFGVGAAECMAAGLPVLCLDTGLMREIVNAGGIRVNAEELDSGFIRMIEEGDALRSVAKEQADRFRPEKIKDQYFGLYRRICISNKQQTVSG